MGFRDTSGGNTTSEGTVALSPGREAVAAACHGAYRNDARAAQGGPLLMPGVKPKDGRAGCLRPGCGRKGVHKVKWQRVALVFATAGLVQSSMHLTAPHSAASDTIEDRIL